MKARGVEGQRNGEREERWERGKCHIEKSRLAQCGIIL